MQNTLLSFLNSVDMSGLENVYGCICYRLLIISYQALNVGLRPKIEGFCHLHAKLMVIFLQYLLLAVTQQCFAKVIYMGQCFFQLLMSTNNSVFSYSLYTHSPVMCLINIQ